MRMGALPLGSEDERLHVIHTKFRGNGSKAVATYHALSHAMRRYAGSGLQASSPWTTAIQAGDDFGLDPHGVPVPLEQRV